MHILVNDNVFSFQTERKEGKGGRKGTKQRRDSDKEIIVPSKARKTLKKYYNRKSHNEKGKLSKIRV